MRFSIHPPLKFSNRDDSEDTKATADIENECLANHLESDPQEDTDESSESGDPRGSRGNSDLDFKALPIFPTGPISGENVDIKNEKTTAIVQAETCDVSLNEHQNTIPKNRNGDILSLDDNEASISSPTSYSDEGTCSEIPTNGESGIAPDTNWSSQSEFKAAAIMSESIKSSPETFSKTDQLRDNSPPTYGDPPIHQSKCSYGSDANVASPLLITSTGTIIGGNEHILERLEISESDLVEIQPEKERSIVRDHTNSSDSEDSKPNDSAPTGDSLVTEFTTVRSSDVHIGQSSPIELLSPKRLLLQETKSRGLEADLDINVKTATLIAEPFEISSTNDGIDSLVDQDDPSDSTSINKNDLPAEYEPPSSFQGEQENEIVKLPSETRSKPHGDQRSLVGDCEGHREKGDAERAQDRESPQLESEGSIRKTRSGTRFSDDTNMLKEFLNREKARKAAKELQVPVFTPAPMTSPRRSPRKAFADINDNSPFPQKPRSLANRPGTPPGKQKLRAVEFDDLGEVATEPTSCRRSTRTRLFAPAKATSDVPSFIPVRRADGVDTIVLQKSLAQELAIVTRSNTRRNKGQSKPPKLTLQTLPAETSDDATITEMSNPNSKSVGWDETLVYYRNASDSKAGKQEKRPKMRKLGSHGAIHGTPASKKLITDVSSSHGASTAKRGDKSR